MGRSQKHLRNIQGYDSSGWDLWMRKKHGGAGSGDPIYGASSLLIPDETNYTLGQYLAYAAPWSKWTPPQNTFVHGVDYEDTILVYPSTFPNGSVISARWPDTLSSTGVYGYMMVSYGNYNNGVPQVPVTPIKVSEIDEFKVNVQWTAITTDLEAWEFLAEFYTTTTSGDLNTKQAEIGFFLHVDSTTIAFMDAGTQHGNWTDPQGRTWKIASDPSGDAGNFIMMRMLDNSNTEGVLDCKAQLNHLVSLGLVNANHYVNGTAVGIEPKRRTSKVSIDTFNVTFTKTVPVEGTNLFASGDPANSLWAATEATKTGGQTDSAGGTTATKLVASTNNSAHFIGHWPLLDVAAAVKSYRYKARVKAAGYSHIELSVDDGAFTSVVVAFFNLSTGAVGASATSGTMTMESPTIIALGGGWYDCYFEFTSTASGSLYPRLYVATGDWAGNFAGNGTGGTLVEKLHMEVLT